MKTITTSIFICLLLLGICLFSACQTPANDSGAINELNSKSAMKLKLSEEQLEKVKQLNEEYWQNRMSLWNDQERPAWHTAILANWDEWVQELEPALDENQYRELLAWQTNVDLLAEHPY